MKPPSIRLRLLAASLLILPLFLGLTAWALDRAFGNYQVEAQQESMRLQQLLLAKAADWDEAGWHIDVLDEPRLSLLDSGLYAFLLSSQGEILWYSPSAELIDGLSDSAAAIRQMLPSLGLDSAGVGDNRYSDCVLDTRYFCQITGVAWGSDGPEGIFLIVESQDRALAAREAYRASLLWLSLAAALLLLLAQSLIVRWGLLPLRRIAIGIKRLERGKSDALRGPYPKELVPLTDNINILLASEKRRRERVRNTMDRLTHVLKTPLMLIRNSNDGEQEFRALVQDQVTRMLGVVEGELAKARLDGASSYLLGKPVQAQPVLARIARAYGKLPRRGELLPGQAAATIDISAVSPDAFFYGEQRDLQDLFGSLLENSLKYCRRHIAVAARIVATGEGNGVSLTICS